MGRDYHCIPTTNNGGFIIHLVLQQNAKLHLKHDAVSQILNELLQNDTSFEITFFSFIEANDLSNSGFLDPDSWSMQIIWHLVQPP